MNHDALDYMFSIGVQVIQIQACFKKVRKDIFFEVGGYLDIRIQVFKLYKKVIESTSETAHYCNIKRSCLKIRRLGPVV